MCLVHAMSQVACGPGHKVTPACQNEVEKHVSVTQKYVFSLSLFFSSQILENLTSSGLCVKNVKVKQSENYFITLLGAHRNMQPVMRGCE